MLVSLVKGVIFTLAPALLLIWSTLPELENQISSSAYLAGKDPSQQRYLLDDLPGKANDLVSTRDNLVPALTWDIIEYALPTNHPIGQQVETAPQPRLVKVEGLLPHLDMPVIPEVGPECTS
ncbi:hypothetical protein DSO57_1001260 [Entomophthora muscae]|uniref:Uncharacterized protein n=1 Tax=Entomophthora muscae TaxID=34485 RepID=A0ACC2SLS2_9FUNG|nr:hypothetical protein DSO57_1001260 [Entomophthora muscae]